MSIRILLLGAAFVAAVALAPLAAQTPDPRPLILIGADAPDLLGAPVTAPVCYAFSGGTWTQCPLQVDERDWLDPAIAYPATISDADELFGGPPQLLYTEPQDYPHSGFDPVVPLDSDPTLDADDEIVTMVRFLGGRADLGANPPPYAPGRVVEVSFEGRFAYLYVPTTPLDQAAGIDLVSYQFDLLAGTFPADYDFEGSTRLRDNVGDFLAANPEYSVAETDYYRTSFEDRWIQRELFLGDATGYGADLLDRVKFGARPDNLGTDNDCSRSIYSASARRGTLGIQKDGPVRALRFAQGFNSGGHNYVLYEMYERYVVYRMAHQMHNTPGATMFFDYSPEAVGMTYYSNLDPAGLAIDGVPDRPAGAYYTEAYIDWDYLLGAEGSLVSVWEVDTNIEGFYPYSYYEDNVTPEVGQCTGDRSAYGSSGNVYFVGEPENGIVPWTDPPDSRSYNDEGELRYLRLIRRVVLDGQTLSASEAQAERDVLQAPLDYTATPRDVGGGPLDTAAPLIEGALNGQTYTGTATDSGPDASGIASVALASGSVNLQLDVDPFAAGASSVGFTGTPIDPEQDASGTVVVRDVAGNESTQPISIEALVVDSAPPEITGQLAGGVYEGTASDDGPGDTGLASVTLAPGSSNVTLAVDAFEPGAASVGFTLTLIDAAQEGQGTVRAEDAAGNVATEPVSIPAALVDETAPDIAGSLEGQTYSGTVSDTGPAATGVASVALAAGAVNLQLDVDPFTAGAASVGFTATPIDPAQDASGTVVAADVAGNEGALPISILAPSVDDDAPLLSGTVDGTIYTGAAEDSRPADTGIAAVRLAPGAVNVTLTVDPFTEGDQQVGFTVMLTDPSQDGSATVEAEDVAGNVATEPVSLTGTGGGGDDTTAPVLSGQINGRQFDGSARDDGPDDTGIASVTLDPAAVNLDLSVDPFTPGGETVGFTVTLQNRREQGKGYVVATDVAGNESQLWVCSDGCDEPGDPPPPGEDLDAPALSGQITGRQFEGLSEDDRPNDTGIASVTLEPGAQNVTLSVDPFTPGAATVGFSVALIDIRQPGSGTVAATDVAGNKGTLFVSGNGARLALGEATDDPAGAAPDEVPPSANASAAATDSTEREGAADGALAEAPPGEGALEGVAEAEVEERPASDRARKPEGDAKTQQEACESLAEAVQAEAAQAEADAPHEADVPLGAQATSPPTLHVAAEALPTDLAVRLFPNPTRRATTLEVGVPAEGPARIEVYDLLGRRLAIVHDGVLAAGWHRLALATRDLPVGVLFVRVAAGTERETLRLTLMR